MKLRPLCLSSYIFLPAQIFRIRFLGLRVDIHVRSFVFPLRTKQLIVLFDCVLESTGLQQKLWHFEITQIALNFNQSTNVGQK